MYERSHNRATSGEKLLIRVVCAINKEADNLAHVLVSLAPDPIFLLFACLLQMKRHEPTTALSIFTGLSSPGCITEPWLTGELALISHLSSKHIR